MDRSKKPEKTTGMKETRESKIPKPTNATSSKETSSKATGEKETAPNLKNTKKATITASKLGNDQSSNLKKCVKRMSVVKVSKDVVNQLQAENLMSEDTLARPSSGTKVREKEKTIQRVPQKEKPAQTSENKSVKLPIKPSGQDLKPRAAFGGIKFIPKKKPYRKLDTFQKVAKALMECKETSPAEPCTKEIKRTVSANAIVGQEAYDKNLDNALSNKAESSKAMYLVKETFEDKYPAFGGIRMVPKRKSTHPIPDMFKEMKEKSKTNDHTQESSHSDTHTEQKEKSPIFAKATSKTETKPPHAEKSEQFSTQKNSKMAAFGGIRFIPKWQSTPLRPGMFDKKQKESKDDPLEAHPTGSSTKLLKSVSASALMKTKAETEHLKSQDPQKNSKKVTPEAHGGLRFKPQQKSRRL